MNTFHNLQVRLAQRPKGVLIPSETFALDSSQSYSIDHVQTGQFLVRVIYLSLDPAMKGWMDDARSYIEPVALGDVMRGGCVGQVLHSKHPAFKAGDYVSGWFGWQKYIITEGVGVQIIQRVPGVKLSDVIGFLGMTGLTAYFGMLDIGQPKPGDTIVVSGAAGATGSVAGQIAKILGCRVIGICGSQEKCDWLTRDLHFDVALNYKDKDFATQLQQATPKFIDVYFDNVGGDILDECLKRLNVGARVVLCGAISQYNTKQPQGPKYYMNLIKFRAKMQGFIVMDYKSQFPKAQKRMIEWAQKGKLKGKVTLIHGLENAPNGLLHLFQGKNIGKLLVQVAPEQAESKL